MPWDEIALNDGRRIPSIGFGSAGIPRENTTDNVHTAFEAGFAHIDTAQAYGNEEEVGQSIRENGINRDDLWITTKWSGRPWGNGESISPELSIKQSLSKLGLKSVDLYLVHTPRLVKGRIQEGWREIEQLHKSGYATSIGVSNFEVADLKEILEGPSIEKGHTIVPAVNQIELHPYNWAKQQKVVEYSQAKGIVIEAWSPLKPLTAYPGGPVDKPVNAIASRLNVKPEQVLLAWIKSKGAVALTTSRSKERLDLYVAAGDIELTSDDIAAIEKAGAKGPPSSVSVAVRNQIFGAPVPAEGRTARWWAVRAVRFAANAALVGYIGNVLFKAYNA